MFHQAMKGSHWSSRDVVVLARETVLDFPQTTQTTAPSDTRARIVVVRLRDVLYLLISILVTLLCSFVAGQGERAIFMRR